jgi:hypothetical protein
MIMGILRDYHCQTHGYFESFDAKCPMKNCDEEVSIVHLQPVGLKSDKTKHNDKTLSQLAMDFDMSDIKSVREGESQSGYLTRNNKTPPEAPREQRPGDAVMWGNTSGTRWNLDSLVKGNGYRSINGEPVGVNPKDLGNLTAPKTASYIADHDNLQINPNADT